MVHKDLFAFTTTFVLFLSFVILLKITPVDTLISHNNPAKQKISMDFITVKQLLCQVAQKKPETTRTKKSLLKEQKKVIKKITKEKTVVKIQESVKVEKVLPKVDEKLLKEKELEVEKAKQMLAQQERLKQIASAQLAQERNIFLTDIKKKINENKAYPRIAKRRSIEGSTHIKFTIYKNGSIKIDALRGNKIFYDKSKEALLESFPVEIPQKIISTFPLQLDIDLMYALS